MTEVIDLLSSSPPQSRERKKTCVSDKSGQADIFDLGSDDLDTAGDLDFLLEPPAKRRKPSPVPRLSSLPVLPSTVPTASQDSVLDLSSDLDLADLLSRPLPQLSLRETNVPPFSSSAPVSTQRKSGTGSIILDLSSDNDEALAIDPIRSSSQGPVATAKDAAFSERTLNLLATIQTRNRQDAEAAGVSKPSVRFAKNSNLFEGDGAKKDRYRKMAESILDPIAGSSQSIALKEASTSSMTEADRTIKVSTKATSKLTKTAEKELEKEKKKREKEAKAKEKQRAADIAEVNKSKTNKKNSTPEMVIEMPNSLRGKSVGNQTEEFMKQLGVELTYPDDEEIDLTNDQIVPLGEIIRWKRNITAEYDEDHEHWQPLPQPRFSTEDHIIVYFKAEDFVTLALAGPFGNAAIDGSMIAESTMTSNLDAYLALLRSRRPKCRPIFLLEGLTAWHKKSHNAKSRAYIAAVRAQAEADPTSSEPSIQPPPRRRKKPNTPALPAIDLSHITPTHTETLLLHLQLHHQPLTIHHTTSVHSTAAQISTFTQHLSTRPYRLAAQSANLASASFCMTTGQIRTGTTPTETWVAMLQEINRVTPSMAYGIVNAGHDTPTELVRRFRTQGREMLQDVRKSANRDGAWSDRRLGPMVSKRIYKVFMGTDPGTRDGIA